MIDISELNTWISTDEGKAWAEALKAPLVAKRDELLESLRQSNAKAAEALRARADSEAILATERKALEKLVVDDALEAELTKAHVYPSAIPGIVAELRESYGLTAQADGLGRKAVGKITGPDGAERAVGIEEAVKAFTLSDRGKASMPGGLNSGGGAPPGGASRPRLTRDALAAMDPRDIAARLDDPAFQAEIRNL